MPENATPERTILDFAVEHRMGELALYASASLTSQVTALFGPSGSGKTTLLRAIAGLLQPAQAHVRLHGRTLTDVSRRINVASEERAIGFVMQRPALFPHMSAEENIGFGLRRWNRERRHARVEEMLTLFRATAFRSRRPRELSGGEQQRIALARALAPMPRLLLLDEPLTGMSSDLKREILHELRAHLTASSTPVLYVTHELPEVFALGAHVLVLENGTITRQGPAERVLTDEREALLVQLGMPQAAASPWR